jgi:adenosylcobinamide kinase/adenosylcobinamide-phosphate guanylyltransferase
MITFISGGARSGKSRFAEELAMSIYQRVMEDHLHSAVNNHTPTPNLYYLATAQAKDSEMVARIERHIEERGGLWQTIEESYNITRVLKSCQADDVILIDCLTIWLDNAMFGIDHPLEIIQQATKEWLRLAEEKRLHILFVSNDVNEGVPSSYDMVHHYIKVLEDIHSYIVREADQAIQVIAGIPLFWKGKPVEVKGWKGARAE